MTEEKYQQLEDLNDAMYALDYDMSNIEDVHSFKKKLEHLDKIVDGLLLMPTEEFSSIIEDFDKRHLGPLYEENPEY